MAKPPDLINESKLRIHEGNIDEGRRLAKQALEDVQAAKLRFLDTVGEPEADESGELAACYDDLAFVFNKTGDDFLAIVCFYFATVFDRERPLGECEAKSNIFWRALVYDQPGNIVRDNHQRLLTFLESLEGIANLAKRLEKGDVGLWMTSDLQKKRQYLLNQHGNEEPQTSGLAVKHAAFEVQTSSDSKHQIVTAEADRREVQNQLQTAQDLGDSMLRQNADLTHDQSATSETDRLELTNQRKTSQELADSMSRENSDLPHQTVTAESGSRELLDQVKSSLQLADSLLRQNSDLKNQLGAAETDRRELLHKLENAQEQANSALLEKSELNHQFVTIEADKRELIDQLENAQRTIKYLEVKLTEKDKETDKLLRRLTESTDVNGGDVSDFEKSTKTALDENEALQQGIDSCGDERVAERDSFTKGTTEIDIYPDMTTVSAGNIDTTKNPDNAEGGFSSVVNGPPKRPSVSGSLPVTEILLERESGSGTKGRPKFNVSSDMATASAWNTDATQNRDRTVGGDPSVVNSPPKRPSVSSRSLSVTDRLPEHESGTKDRTKFAASNNVATASDGNIGTTKNHENPEGGASSAVNNLPKWPSEFSRSLSVTDNAVEPFYDQSCQQYFTPDKKGAPETSMANLMNTGLQLSESFLNEIDNKNPEVQEREAYYPEMLNSDALTDRLLKQPNKFKKCILQIESSHVAKCIPIASSDSANVIEISGRSKTNQAFCEDEVVIELLDKEIDKHNKRFGKVVGITKLNRHKDPMTGARINHPVLICTLDGMESNLVRPMCRTVPKIHIMNKLITEQYKHEKRFKVEIYKYDEKNQTLSTDREHVHDINPGDRENHVFLVVFVKWDRQHVYPIGAIIGILPLGTTLENGLTILNLQHRIPALYTRETVEEVKRIITEQNNGEDEETKSPGREDLTHLTTFTIDPPGALDLDDAISIEPIDDYFRVGVHIADVSEYVMKDDPVDMEAKERSLTIYSEYRRHRHMLPEPLSTNMCSLKENKVRPTISIFFLLNKDGGEKQMEGNTREIVLAFIKSEHQFTYADAQRIIDDEKKEKPCSQQIKQLHELAKATRKLRLGRARFSLDVDDTDRPEDAPDARNLIEEYMIIANKKVAQTLIRRFPECVPLRCQQPPSQEDVQYFDEKHHVYIDAVLALQDRTIGNYLKPDLDKLSQAKNTEKVVIVKKIWDNISDPDKKAARYINTDALYPMQYLTHCHWMDIQKRSVYKCSESKITEDTSHSGLNLDRYTHFTSPIRRYNDLLVHRLLKALLCGQPCPYTKEEVQYICAHLNTRETRVKEYQRRCRALQKALVLKHHPRMVSSFIEDVSDKGVSVRLPSLHNISRPEIQFRLLGVGFKPERVENSTRHDTIKVTWAMRLFNLSKRTNKGPDGGKTLIVNPYQEMRYISLQRWGNILKSCIEDDLDELQNQLSSTEVEQRTVGVKDISTECRDDNMIQANTMFSTTFTHGQILKVQMTAVPRMGVLVPCPELYAMTDNVKLCLLHKENPVLYLSHYTTRATKDQYESASDYLGLWLPIIEMEAATGAVSNEESCLLSDVTVNMFENTGNFILSAGKCEVRNIDFSGTVIEEEENLKDPGSSFDWLCLRCDISERPRTNQSVKSALEYKSFWLGHAVVTKAKKINQDIEVGFRLHERSPPVPGNAKVDTKFQIEILRKTEVDRRTESFLKSLSSLPTSLAERIARKDKKSPIQPLDEERKVIARDEIGVPDLHVQTAEGPWYPLPRNNLKQQMAVDKALVSRFTLIQGPPGTGKTHTGIKLICLFDKINKLVAKKNDGQGKKQVLFCGPSNKSVDLVGNLIKNRLEPSCRPKFIRVYGRSIEAIDFPIPGRSFLTKKSIRNQKTDAGLKDFSLHYAIRKEGKDGNSYAEKINEMDRMFKENDYMMKDPADVYQYVHIVREASIEEIRKYDVVLCTTAIGSNPKVLNACSVFQVIIDEAGMCTEPQCLVPIIATSAEQVVLIGDHKQLRPIINCREAAELGLDRSLFERYVSKENKSFTMLEQQYRMHPEICKFPSDCFYNGRLRTNENHGRWKSGLPCIWQKSRGITPHVLVHVEGEENALTVTTEEGNQYSKSNAKEVQHVVKVYRYLIDEGVSNKQIHILSQYNAQCSEIRKALEEQRFVDFTVSTVVSSQGGEWDYVIFSTVRSQPDYKIERIPTIGWCKHNLGFITDQNQINVAITRASKGLVIIGNRKLLGCSDVWRRLVKHYKKLGSIKTPEEFPPEKTPRQQKMQNQGLQIGQKFKRNTKPYRKQ